ncbi:MAG: HAMP domain-containing sensor histidine kinase [Slackia sp.]|nr:HAMP domain-containing sensor histidine kinase [Slackia sp.]
MDTLRTLCNLQLEKKPSHAKRAPEAEGRRDKRGRGIPFSLFIVRYFMYVLVGAFLVAGIVVSLLITAVDSGMLYPGNYASINHESMVGEIEARGTVTADDVPSCYRWGVFDGENRLIEGDFDARTLELAQGFLREDALDQEVYSSLLSSPIYATSASLANGNTCVLVYDFNPDFASKTLRDSLPDPQGTMLAIGVVLFAGMVAAVAMRASHMLRRKLSPLVDAAERIGERELDFAIAYGNVRETNEVLAAFDAMRTSLKTSLEEQWAAEAAQHEALSALAHDLKTPLTIVRGNADLLAETKLNDEQTGYARFIQEATDDMEDFIGRIIDVTRFSTESKTDAGKPVSAHAICNQVTREAKALANAHAGVLAVHVGHIPSQACVRGNGIAEAVLNLVDNAFEYGNPPVTLTCDFRKEKQEEEREVEASDCIGWLEIIVQDEGDGFSKAALARATERFYRDDAARTHDGHHGLGLAIAQERTRACGGELLLDNTDQGARATLRLPCTKASI